MERKYSFRKGSEYFRIFYNNSVLYSHFYIEKRDSLEDFLRDREQSINSNIRNLSKKFKLNQEDITSIKEFNVSLFPRISESEYSYIKKRAFLIFTYSEMEQYFFRCMNYCIIKTGVSEIQAEKETVDFIMRNNWEKIFEGFKTLHRLNHNLNSNLIDELQKFKIIRNLFAHGNGTINQKYLNNFPNSNQKFGEKLNLIPELIFKYFNLSSEIIAYFDDALLKIFPELTYNP
jgi:hypothetical protein